MLCITFFSRCAQTAKTVGVQGPRQELLLGLFNGISPIIMVAAGMVGAATGPHHISDHFQFLSHSRA